jgi:hypothetical protein
MREFIKKIFSLKPKTIPAVVETPVESAPYKMPEPAETTLIPLVVEEPAVEVKPAKAKKAPAKKATVVKKPRAPRKPKAV